MQKPLSEMTLQELWQLFPIQLKEYDPQYPQWYREKEAEVRRQLAGVSVARISHIGSTAVEGLLSKTTVDILAELADPAQITAAKEALVLGGWVLMCEEKAPAPKLSFNQGYTPNGFAARVFHLHLRVVGDWGELYFRDYLRAEKAAAAEYAALKRGLQQQYEHDRDGSMLKPSLCSKSPQRRGSAGRADIARKVKQRRRTSHDLYRYAKPRA